LKSQVNKMVYALIPAKDRYEYTKECIESFLKQKYKNIQIIVIDDGSVDGTPEKLAKGFPSVKVIKGDGNLWCMGAFAKGVDYVKEIAKDGDFILTQNQDAYFGNDFVSQLVGVSEINDRAIVGSINLSTKTKKAIYHNHIIRGGVFRPNLLTGELPSTIDSDTLNTRGTLFPIEVFEKINNFSPLFPHYAGDYEIACRAKKNGFKLLVSTEAICYSWDGNVGLAKRISMKKKKTLKDMFDLFFSRRSSSNVYYSTLLVILWVPFPDKILGVLRILLFSLKYLLYDYLLMSVLLGWKN